MEELRPRVKVRIENREVSVKAWLREIRGIDGFCIPVLNLDTNGENAHRPWDSDITSVLYEGKYPDPEQRRYYRLVQEIVLGVGGMRMLEAVGWNPQYIHLNEGHGAFAALEAYRKLGRREAVQAMTDFTTHTPVPAGHDTFPYSKIDEVFGAELAGIPCSIRELAGRDHFNVTVLAMNLSGYRNGVATLHGEVSRRMFPGYEIGSITNGVHHGRWTGEPLKALYDRRLPGWERDPTRLARAREAIPLDELFIAHAAAKTSALQRIRQQDVIHRGSSEPDPAKMLLGEARRFATYKRGDMAFDDIEWLKSIGGQVQIAVAGKAHPHDNGGKQVLQRIVTVARELRGQVDIYVLEGYDVPTAQAIIPGCDVWLNTPIRGHEASGTSGMKAAVNGVLNCSIRDGWWEEVAGAGEKGGWSIGGAPNGDMESDRRAEDLASLKHVLSNEVLPLYFRDRDGWGRMMLEAISLGSHYNTHRMVAEYLREAYAPSKERALRKAA